MRTMKFQKNINFTFHGYPSAFDKWIFTKLWKCNFISGLQILFKFLVLNFYAVAAPKETIKTFKNNLYWIHAVIRLLKQWILTLTKILI